MIFTMIYPFAETLMVCFKDAFKTKTLVVRGASNEINLQINYWSTFQWRLIPAQKMKSNRAPGEAPFFKVQFEVFIFNPGSTDAAIKYSQLLQSPSSYHIGRLVSFSPILPRNTTTIVENLFSNQSNNICNLTPFKGVMMYQHCSEKRKIQFFKETHV